MAMEVIEAEEAYDTSDYFFEKIGDPIPCFDAQTLTPSSGALVVSDRRGLVFVGLGAELCVGRTKDVVAAARTKAADYTLARLRLPLDHLHILSLSSDHSTLAVASVTDGVVHFFRVDDLLLSSAQPCFTRSLPDGDFVRDLVWTLNAAAYLLLSRSGQLYRGVGGEAPLEHLMDGVDALGLSPNGRHVALATADHALSIHSSKSLNQTSRFLLPLQSWASDSDSTIQVDALKWVRSDSIVLGCFQLTPDGQEENYLVQVIRTPQGKFSDASTKPVAVSFYDFFSCVIDDILPFRTGPYLLLAYLDYFELAITANKKNTDGHVVLLGWSLGEEKNDVASIDIQRDKWLPRIELQENGDDNLILGLCIDQVSCDGKFRVEVGNEEWRELSPHCILLCLTLEGKLVLFNVASVNATKVSPLALALSDEEEEAGELVPVEIEVSKSSVGPVKEQPEKFSLDLQLQDMKRKELNIEGNNELDIKTNFKPTDVKVLALSDEEEEAGELVPVEIEVSKSSVGPVKEQPEKFSLDLQLQDMKRKELNIEGNNELDIKTNFKPTDVNKSHIPAFSANEASHKEGTIRIPGVKSLVNSESVEADGKQEVLPNFRHPMNIGSVDTEQNPMSKASFPEPHHQLGRDMSTAFSGFGLGAFSVPADFAGQLNHKELNATVELGKVSPVNYFGSTSFLGASSQSLHNSLFVSPKVTEVKSPLVPSSNFQRGGSGNVHPNTTTGASNPAGKVFRVKETVGTSTPQSSANILLQNWGQRPTAGSASGNIESLPSIRTTHVASQEIGILADSRNHPSMENYRTLPQSGMLNSEPNLSKQFGNIKDMTKDLDVLLNSIEQPGGFRDACTVSQKSSVETVEQGIQNVSDKCRMWQGIVEERLLDVQNLLDKTVQVLARKIYMEGIVKQISDNQYWDLWNRQKLSPELDLKRRHILKLNEDLTNQLIELERHFNSIELKKFAENGGAYVGKRSSESRYGPSRQIQSFHSLHNTLSSQLAAADKLSESLSKQMSKLKIESPSLKQKNVKKELFETIGIHYDASFNSPNVAKVSDVHFDSKLLLSACSTAAKEKSRGKSSVLKGYGQETARRRRESLDRSWTSYEPSKTTVKRLLLQESRKPRLSADKQIFSSHLLERSAGARSKDYHTSSSTLPLLENKAGGVGELPKQINLDQATPFVKDHSQSIKFSGLTSTTLQRDTTSSASRLVSSEGQKLTRDAITGTTTVEKLGGKSDNAPTFKENKSFLQFETSIQQKQSLPTSLAAQTPIFLKTPSEELNSRIETVISSSVTDSTIAKNKPFSTSSFSAFGVKHVSPISQTSVGSGLQNVPKSVLQPDAAASKSQPVDKVSSAPSLSVSPFFKTSSASASSSVLFSSSTAAQTSLSTTTPMRGSLTSWKSSAEPKPSISVSPVPSPPGAFSFQIPKPAASTEAQASSKADNDAATTNQAPVEPDIKSEVPILKTETQLQPAKPEADDGKKTPAVPPDPTKPATPEAPIKIATVFSSTPSPPLNTTTMKSQPEVLSSVPPSLFQTQVPTPNTDEDDMDEEASESTTAAELSLGSLGGFGLGSVPNSTAPKPNPFGGPFGNPATNASSSPFTMNMPSGELFRPASFSFQSAQPQQTPQTFSGGFGAPTPVHAPTSGFGQPAQIGQGQQALGSVLGSFGQSRQLGAGLPGTGFGTPSGFGAGLSSGSGGGFANITQSSAISGAGFANISPSSGGGFANISPSSGGGFGNIGSAAGGFGGLASSGGGGGFGAFSGQAGTGGFSSFGSGNLAASGKPAELFTQMRK